MAKVTAKAKPRARKAKAAATTFEKITLHSLAPARGATQAPKRVGRGPGSGLGKTAGRGGKGQTARTGGRSKIRQGFEGGQMPLVRRVPKRGFTNPFRDEAQVVNVRHLALLPDGAEVTPQTLYGAGLVRSPERPIKLLGMGEVKRGFVVKAVGASASARQKIEAAGGRIEA